MAAASNARCPTGGAKKRKKKEPGWEGANHASKFALYPEDKGVIKLFLRRRV